MFLVLIATLFWSLDTLFRFPLLHSGIGVEKLVFSEQLILVILCIPIFIRARQKIWDMRLSQIIDFLIIGGIGQAIGGLYFTKAFIYLNPSLVILLQKLQPLVAISLAALLLKEKIRKQFIIWTAVCMVGSLVIAYKDIIVAFNSMLDGTFFTDNALTGYIYTLIAVFVWGSSVVFAKRLSNAGFEVTELLAGRFLCALLVMIPFVYYAQPNFDLNPAYWGKVTLMVILSGMIGMYFYYLGLKRISARVCALAEMTLPIWAILINWYFLNLSLDYVQIAGGAILLLGSTVIQLKRL